MPRTYIVRFVGISADTAPAHLRDSAYGARAIKCEASLRLIFASALRAHGTHAAPRQVAAGEVESFAESRRWVATLGHSSLTE
eukprot:1713230-Prymnesium_polylepis.1